MNIVHSSVFMKLEPTETSTLKTEYLIDKTVEILEECLDWVYCIWKAFAWIQLNLSIIMPT